MPQFRKICISAVMAIAMLASSMPIAYSGTTDTQYIARRSTSFGRFRSRAACRARGRRLVRRGVIRGFRCVSASSRVKRRNLSKRRIAARRVRRASRQRSLGTFRSIAACRARGRRLVRAGVISSYRCYYRRR
jgi:DNA-binding Lrp family transcriptional regulator